MVNKLGLYEYLHQWYYYSLHSHLLDGTWEYTVDEATVTFLLETHDEYTHFRPNLLSERPVTEEILAELRSDDIFYDIGANVGGYTCLAAMTIKNGDVVAIEPHPANTARIKDNLEHNALSAQVYQCALSNQHGELPLSPSIAPEPRGVSPSTAQVAVGDDLVDDEEIPRPNIVKIDVDGSEYQVLKGLEKTLTRTDCRLIYCEIHPEFLKNSTPQDIHSLLREYGYDIDKLHERDHEYFVRASR